MSSWNRFWFEADARAHFRVFRIGFGVLLLGCYLIRSFDLELFFGQSGIMPLAAIDELIPMEYRWSIFRYWSSDTALWIGNAVFLASLVTLVLGVIPRISVVVAWVLHVSFVHRNLAVAYGVDTVACFFLFFLCLADYREDREYRPGDLQATLGSMAYRLAQIQICIIYGYSGLKKLKGYTWWNGEAMWNSLTQTQLARWDFGWTAHFPLALAAATFLTLAWEIYFPALVWIRPLRKPMLAAGIVMHLGIAVTLNLPFFAALMVLTYVFFLDKETLLRLSGPDSPLKSILVRFSKVPARASE